MRYASDWWGSVLVHSSYTNTAKSRKDNAEFTSSAVVYNEDSKLLAVFSKPRSGAVSPSKVLSQAVCYRECRASGRT